MRMHMGAREGYVTSTRARGALVKIKASGAKERVTVHLDDLKVFVPRADSEVVNSVNSVCLRDWAPDVIRPRYIDSYRPKYQNTTTERSNRTATGNDTGPP
jgi:hypothetical protein